MFGIHSGDVCRHGPRIHEGVVRHCCHRVRHMLIGVGNPGDVGGVVVDDRGVVDIGHLGHANPRVRDVHVVHIARAGAIPRHKNFARCKREPSHAGADANSKAETSSAHECDQSWRIDRPGIDRTRYPAPRSSYKCPPSIVEGSKTPRLVFNPSPAPRRDPNPVTVAVGGPSGSDYSGRPHWAIARGIAPVAVLIQVGCARHIG